MSKMQALIIFCLAVLLIIGIIFFVRSIQGKPEGEVSATPEQTTNMTTPKVETINGCTRSFDESKLTAQGVVIKDRLAVLQVKGFGEVTVELYDKDAPKTVENFVRLAESGFYDCLSFHRIAKGFVIQGGDPNGDGTGGRTASGGPLVDELDPQTASYKQGYVKGVLAMANKSLPSSGSSQFFVMLGDVDLDHKYTIFGKVISGMDVVDKVGALYISPVLGPTDGSPKQPVIIEKVTIKNK
jgi:cyclophilin family peptidyl-prolyl cis-trans isomerase